MEWGSVRDAWATISAWIDGVPAWMWFAGIALVLVFSVARAFARALDAIAGSVSQLAERVEDVRIELSNIRDELDGTAAARRRKRDEAGFPP